MTKIRCPHCGFTTDSQLNLQGQWLVTCGECQKKFSLWVLSGRPRTRTVITCPNCGAREEVSLAPENLKVKCEDCSFEFTL